MRRSHSLATTMQAAAAATGDGTALPLGDYAMGALQLSGTFSATVTFEATVDGSNWIAVALANANSTTRARATTATAAGIFLLEEAAGLTLLRARVSAYTSGNVTVVGVASS